MNREIQVLDKGYVKYIRHMGDDNSPVEDARMSTGNPTGVDIVKDDKLRSYLWKHQHTTTYEGCVLTLELKLPLFILHQLDRHRTLDIEGIETYDSFRQYTSRNEFSGRYAEFADEFYIPDIERIKSQDTKNKQGSDGELSVEVRSNFIQNLEHYCDLAFWGYKNTLEQGISREIARMLVPNNVYTKIRVTANLLNWFKFLKLRLDEHAQWEVRMYAQAIEEIIKEIWPKCHEVFSVKG